MKMQNSVKAISAFVCFVAVAALVYFYTPHGDGDCGDHCMVPLLPGDIETETAPVYKTASQLAVRHWVQGPEVQIGKGRVTVVEFWEPWCPPCLLTIPHLEKLHKQFKDKGLDIVGLTGDKPDVIKAFIARQGGGMSYPVAISSPADFKNYFGDSDSVGIPHAFVIDREGRIVWEGSPVDSKLITVGPDGSLVAGGYPFKAEFDDAIEKALDATPSF